MKRTPVFLAAMTSLVAVLLIIGCTSLSTLPAPPSGIVNGMPYYLPIGKITIKGEYSPPAISPVALAEIFESKALPSPSPSDSGGSSPKPKDSPSKGGSSDAAPAPNSVVVAAAGWTITLTAEVEADADAPRYAAPRRNYMFDDEIHVTVNSKQLLTVGNATAEDRTVDVVGSVASLVTQGLGARTMLQKALPQPFYFSFHPTSKGQVTFVEDQLRSRDIDFRVIPDPRDANAVTGKANVPLVRNEFEERGLAFRRAIPYKVTLKSPRNSAGTINYSHQFLLPDVNGTYVLDYDRMPFVKKVTEIGFTDGMLTDFHQTLPSPVLGFLGIPKAILNAIVPLPSGMNSGGSGSKAGVGGN